jgi:hypothetical protein
MGVSKEYLRCLCYPFGGMSGMYVCLKKNWRYSHLNLLFCSRKQNSQVAAPLIKLDVFHSMKGTLKSIRESRFISYVFELIHCYSK